jgi:hypothetical protein
MSASLADPMATVIDCARAVARSQGLTLDDVLRPRGWARRRARNVAGYLACTLGDVPASAIGRCLSVSRFHARRLIVAVEERRDDPAYDAWLSGLEDQIQRGDAA